MVFLFDCWVNLIGFFYCVDCNFHSIVFPPSTQLLPSYNFNRVMKYGLYSWPYLKWMSFSMCHMMTSLPVDGIKIMGILVIILCLFYVIIFKVFHSLSTKVQCLCGWRAKDTSKNLVTHKFLDVKINCYVKTVSSFLISIFCLHNFIIYLL